jgi:xylan 1,4-beta-xylosidase
VSQSVNEYVNPVVRGFAPDPSVIRVGDWYYLAVSSFEWFPNIPLYRSRDLGAWEYVGSVDTAVPGGSLLGVPDSGGIWAPALSYANGLFWVTYGLVRSVSRRHYDVEVYVATAHEVSGPWSEPVRVPGYGFDPSLFHQNGQLWYLNLINDTRVGGRRFDGIVALELRPSYDGAGLLAALTPVGVPSLLLQQDNLIEGPKLTYHDGWYYLLCAEGGTSFNHGVLVARSRNLLGPYEVASESLITTRNNADWPLQKTGHGELVQAPSGSWYLSYLASRPLATPDGPRSPLGRETAIAPIEWVDGWPWLVGGGTCPPLAIDLSDAVTTSTASRLSSGETTTISDTWPWSTLRRQAGDWVTLDGGAVTIQGGLSAESLWQQSLLAQRLTEHQAQVAVTVEAEPTTFSQSAGLILYYNTSSYVQFHVTWAEPEGVPLTGQQWRGEGRRMLVLEMGRPDGAVILAKTPAPGGPVRLSATINDGVGQFYFALPDGGWSQVGGDVDLTELSDDYGKTSRFTGTFVGVNAVDLTNEGFTARFTDWSYECGFDSRR